MSEIFKIVAGSESGSDTTSISVVRIVPRAGEEVWEDNVCECFDWETAVLICALLNKHQTDTHRPDVYAAFMHPYGQ